MRVNISIETELLKKFDEFCTKYHFGRSEFISALMRATVFDDLTLKGGRTIVQKVISGENEKGVKPQEASTNETGTPREIRLEQIGEDSNWLPVLARTEVNYCQLVFERGVKQKVFLISFEDQSGKLIYDAKWACEKCLQNLKNKIKTEGGRLIGT